MNMKPQIKNIAQGFIRQRSHLIILVLSVLFLVACQEATSEPPAAPIPTVQPEVEQQVESPSVSVSDQEIVDRTVNIAEVISDGPGWLVVHAQAEGKPGAILGYSQVIDGLNENVLVEIDVSNTTETMYAMLHADLGEAGLFEFPGGPDVPVEVEGERVTPPFSLTNLVAVQPYVMVVDQQVDESSVIVSAALSDGPGWLVVHAQAEGNPGPIIGSQALQPGLTENLKVKIEEADATETLYAMLHVDAGELGRFEFPDGPDIPVTLAGEVVAPAFRISRNSEQVQDALILLGGNDELGPFLTGADGMTLYVFVNDDPGISNCYDQCAQNWPPLILEEGQAFVASEGIGGELGTAVRNDGSMQVTYNQMPLYYWINDTQPGDATGHGVFGTWAVAGEGMRSYRIIPGESQVTYEVGEVFLNQDNRFNVAVGITDQLSGEGFLDLSNPQTAWIGPVTVDISQFTSDSSRRDNAIRRDFLESTQFPIATFVPTQIEGLPLSYSDGQQVSLKISGELTVREVTRQVSFEATLQAVDGVVLGEATTTILMSDFGVGPISILGILNTEDEVKLTLNLFAQP